MAIIEKKCIYCNGKFLTNYLKQRYCSKYCKFKAIKNKSNYHKKRKEQLCWTCKNATGGCSWSDSLIPVKGWCAKPTVINECDGTSFESYEINSCPNYINR